MTGFDSLSGDILAAMADKFAARDAKKGQMADAKGGEKTSKAFGTHLNRLAQEHGQKSATSKADDVRAEASRAAVRSFALSGTGLSERTQAFANAKVHSVVHVADEAEQVDPSGKDDSLAVGEAQDLLAQAMSAADSRPSTLVLHAAMGFTHTQPALADAAPSKSRSDTHERTAAAPAKVAAKADDTASDASDGPQMPAAAADVPEFSAVKFTESADLSLQNSSIRAPMPTKVAVVSQETHFEPVLPSATLQQIANAIGDEMPVTQDIAAVPVSAVTTLNASDKAGPVKTLTLQLDPASLGSVTVKMKLTGAAIEVQIAASRPETAQLLEHDRGALSRLLQASGYETDVATVQVQSVAASSSSSDAGQSASNFQGQSGQSSSQGQFDPSNQRASDQRSGAQQNQQERRPFASPQEERHGHESVARSGTTQSGALYL